MKNNLLNTRIISSIFILILFILILSLNEIFFSIVLFILLIISLYESSKFKISKYLLYPFLIFIVFSFFLTFALKKEFNELFFLTLIICISTDIGGYFIGKIVRGPKITNISPNKTYSGAIGSLIFSVIFSLIFLKLYDIKFEFYFRSNFDFFYKVIALSLISQIGDLFLSYCKRKSNIKDTGKLIPGHGGLLDRIDGMLFAFPVTCTYYLF